MSIGVTCPKCGWSGRAKNELAGRRVKCPTCATPFRVIARGETPKAAARSAVARPPLLPPPPPRPFSPAEARGLVTGTMRPVGTTLAYRLSLAMVGLMMILLPLTYLGMIAGIGGGVWWHLVHNVRVLSNHGLRGKAAAIPILAYVGPAVIGAILVLFMVKPLLARRQREAAPHSLRPEDEPTLYAFVNRICQAVGAPVPKRIDVDLQVNASASHRRGLASLAGNDLVLTIGLPLVAGLSVDQFAGVLAHEFGHFTQGAGMGFGALISRVNGWFARVVWQRDAWDLRLEAWEKGSDLWIGMILCLARWCVWLTRRILFGLMWVAHALSCHLSRQMEYDADLHQTRLVGGRVVAETLRSLPRLSVAEQKAWQLLEESWFEGILADSVPDLVVELSNRLSPEERLAIDTSVTEEKTALFSTHPAVRERIARASSEGATAMLVSTEPAARLFTDFHRLSCLLSLAKYSEALPGKVTAAHLRPASALLSQQEAEKQAREAAERWMGADLIPHLPFPGGSGAAERTAEACLGSLRETLATLRSTPPHPSETLEAVGESLTKHRHTFLVESFVSGGRRHDDARLGETFHSIADVERFREGTWRDVHSLSAPLLERRTLLDRRLRAALGWLASPQADGAFPDVDARRAEVARLSDALSALTARQADWITVAGRVTALGFWLEYLVEHEINAADGQAFTDLLNRTKDAIRAIRTPLLGKPYPLEHTDRTMTIGRYLVPEEVPEDPPEAVIVPAQRVTNLFPYLGWQLVGRLILQAEAVEAAALGDRTDGPRPPITPPPPQAPPPRP